MTTLYEKLQQELDTAARQRSKQESEAHQTVSLICQILEKEMGFPRELIGFRRSVHDAEEEREPTPGRKIGRNEKGAWTVTLDLRVNPDDKRIPTQLPSYRTLYIYTFLPLEIRFPDDKITLGLDGNAIELPELPEARMKTLREFCNGAIQEKIQGTVRWLATGEGNPDRRMGFHPN
jgi:hypothetical protein